MSDQTNSSDARPPRPTSDDPKAWSGYWQESGQPWRTKPEINKKRQEELVERRAIRPDFNRSIYPFTNIELNRADVEWLLATHEGGRGLVDWSDEKQRDRRGLDLRGAVLRDVDLSKLPLAGLIGDSGTHLEGAILRETHLEGTRLARAHLENAVLREALLESAELHGAHLESAYLYQAHLEHARLSSAHLENADLRWAHLENASPLWAHLENADLRWAHLENAMLSEAHLENANLYQAHLENAYLKGAHLENAFLYGARLENAYLEEAHLENADLRWAHLENADLRKAHLEGKDVESAVLERVRKWRVRPFRSEFPETLYPANLQGAFFDSGTDLRQTYFGNTKYGFPYLADVRWGDTNLAVLEWGPMVGNLGDERHAETTNELGDYQPAVRANRQLAVALRGQGMTEVADRFAYRAQVLQRKVYRLQRHTGRLLLSLFSWVIAGYGYRPAWTLGWYVGVIFACALLYYLLGSEMDLADALIGSVTAFHGRGLFDNTPLNSWQGAVASVEAFFGLVIEIAFIVTFTQRFFGK